MEPIIITLFILSLPFFLLCFVIVYLMFSNDDE